jgi:hypothetical protein
MIHLSDSVHDHRHSVFSSDSSTYSDEDSDEASEEEDSDEDSDEDSEDEDSDEDSDDEDDSDESSRQSNRSLSDISRRIASELTLGFDFRYERRGGLDEDFRMGLDISAVQNQTTASTEGETVPPLTPIAEFPVPTLSCSVCLGLFATEPVMESCSNRCCSVCCSRQPLFCPSHYHLRPHPPGHEVGEEEGWSESTESSSSGEEEDEEGSLAMEINE